MKVLLVHNTYQQRGGEDTVFESEQRLLKEHGHDIAVFREDNSKISGSSLREKVRLAGRTIWSEPSYKRLREIIVRFRPQIAHFHNTFPLISPSAYYACRKMDVPIVQTLHNYRLLCPNGNLFRGDAVCTECLDHTLLRSVQYGCYRGSHAATATVAAMLAAHRYANTWHRMVNHYIVPTKFAEQVFVNAGLPRRQLSVKSNFLFEDYSARSGDGNYALFVGRLSIEKGVKTLLEAFSSLPDIPLLVVGDGPLRDELERDAKKCSQHAIEFLGALSHGDVLATMKNARFLVFPSILFETFGMTIVEAYACGLPVIASRLGVMQEIVVDGRTGLHFEPGNARSLAETVGWAWSHPLELRQMAQLARVEFEAKYSADRNYDMLMEIYHRVIRESVQNAAAPIVSLPGEA